MTKPDKELEKRIIEYRREFHRFPELSWEEEKTAEKLCEILSNLGISFQSRIAKHGIVAEIPGKAKKPFIALRADMDGLPIHEETGLEFSSENKGVMHACGHDAHMSILLGAAEILLKQEELPYPVRLIFQPAEEKGAGAKEMVEQGVLEDVKFIFGGHVDRHYPVGQLIISEGAVNASTDEFDIEIEGQGAHGARPHESTDAVVVGSLIIMTLQTLVSREVDPAHPSVVSVGEFKAGSAPNVIADRATLRGTIRSQDREVRETLVQGVQRIAKSICDLHGARCSVSISGGTPPLLNSAAMVELARKAAASVVDPDDITQLHKANMGGEDFAYFLQEVPGCYIRYGAQKVGAEDFPAHSSKFDIDERALPLAAQYLATVALEAMKQI